MEHLVENKFESLEKTNIEDNLFNLPYNEALIHQVLTSYISNLHTGIKKQKSRSEVSGGGKKPWRQKGTGRARAGSIRSPLWKGGGKVFAAKGIERRKRKINKKMYKNSIKIIISQLMYDKRISIIDEIDIQNNKTKTFLNKVKYLNIKEKSLFILKNINQYVNLATRNLKNISIIQHTKINPLILLKFKKIYITKSGIKEINENLK